MITEALELFFICITIVMVAYLVRHYLFTFSVLRKAKIKTQHTPLDLGFQPSVSILIPALNEEKVIGRLLQRIGSFTYPKEKMQVIVINDASTDRTQKIAEEYTSKYSFMRVLNRESCNGRRGKASAMNHGFSKCTGEIVLCFDADYYPQRDIVESLVREFVDPKVGAVQGRVVVLNEPQNLVTRLVAMERIGGYRVDQKARNDLGLITQFGGTVGGFRSSVLKSLQGWDETILAEDTDLTFRVYLAGYKVHYAVEAECYEEAVDTWRTYWRQRYRWAKGHMQCSFKHSLSVLTSKKLSKKQKIDGLMLLAVYFMPILALLALLIGFPLIFLGSPIIDILWLSIPISLYTFVGNFAPFFEVGAGIYLDGRTRTQWLIPLLLFTFLLNIPLCLKAFGAVLYSKIRNENRLTWAKTKHSGNGSQTLAGKLTG